MTALDDALYWIILALVIPGLICTGIGNYQEFSDEIKKSSMIPASALDLPEVTRVCVVTEVERRVLDMRDAYPHGCEVFLMDEGRTIKILPRQETPND